MIIKVIFEKWVELLDLNKKERWKINMDMEIVVENQAADSLVKGCNPNNDLCISRAVMEYMVQNHGIGLFGVYQEIIAYNSIESLNTKYSVIEYLEEQYNKYDDEEAEEDQAEFIKNFKKLYDLGFINYQIEYLVEYISLPRVHHGTRNTSIVFLSSEPEFNLNFEYFLQEILADALYTSVENVKIISTEVKEKITTVEIPVQYAFLSDKEKEDYQGYRDFDTDFKILLEETGYLRFW